MRPAMMEDRAESSWFRKRASGESRAVRLRRPTILLSRGAKSPWPRPAPRKRIVRGRALRNRARLPCGRRRTQV